MFVGNFLSGEFCAALGGEITTPMKTVSVHGTVNDVLTTFTIRQTYYNDSNKNIDAWYAFKIPPNAVLLGMDAQFGDHKLTTRVQASDTVVAAYKVLNAGDGPVQIKKSDWDDGLYEAHFGNFKPGVTAVVEYRYAVQHTWQEQKMIVQVPTIVHPLYFGKKKIRKTDDFTIDLSKPEDMVITVPQWQFSLNVTGTLAKSSITCHTHPISSQTVNDKLQVSMTTLPDHDIILNIEPDSRLDALAISEKDKDGWVLAADLMPDFSGIETGNLNLDILIYCSKYMDKTAMQQMWDGVMLILDNLSPQDFFNITNAGMTRKSLFAERQPANDTNLLAAKDFVNSLRSKKRDTGAGHVDLTGIFSMQGGEGDRSILFIADRFKRPGRRMQDAVSRSGCRIMAMHIGDARKTDVDAMRELADLSGGMSECVKHGEAMSRQIYRCCMRLRRSKNSEKAFLSDITDSFGLENAILEYDGDTVHVFANCAELPAKEILFQATMDGKPMSWRCTPALPESTSSASTCVSDLARVAAASRLKRLPDETSQAIDQQIAVDYQLLSKWTTCILVSAKPAVGKVGSPNGSVATRYEAIEFGNRWGEIRHGSIVMLDMDGEIKHCIADVDSGVESWMRTKPYTSTIKLYDIETSDQDDCLIKFQIEVPSRDDEEILPPSSKREPGPYPCCSVCEPDIWSIQENLVYLRQWVRFFLNGRTPEEVRIAQCNILRLLGGENTAGASIIPQHKSQLFSRRNNAAFALLASNMLHDYATENIQCAERYYDTIENLRLSQIKKLRFRDAGDIILDYDMRLKVVSECSYDPESDETRYTFIDLYTGKATSGTQGREYKCIFLGDIRYFEGRDGIEEFDYYQKHLVIDLAKIVCNYVPLVNNLEQQIAQSMALRVTEILFNALSKHPNRKEIPPYDALHKIISDAFMEVCERKSATNA